MLSVLTVPEVGEYVSLPKILVMLVAATPWLYAAPWVAKDVKKVLANPYIWTSLTVGLPSLGILLWLLLGSYVVGLVLFAVLTLGAFGAYVFHRNGRVEPEKRVLTPGHLKKLMGTRRKRKVLAAVEKIKLYDHHNKIVHTPTEDAPEEIVTAYNLVQDLLYDMVYYRASEADLSPVGETTRVRYVIDGVAVEREAMESEASESIVQFLKPASGMDFQERRRPQSGKISIDIHGKQADITVATAGTTTGQRVQFRILQEAIRTDVEQLGMTPAVLKSIRSMLKQPPGLVIVAGRPQSGVTSTMYSLLRDQDAYTKHLVTLETKPALDLENVTQNSYTSPQELSSSLASALRRDPDVVMIDACPDQQVAQQIAQASGEKIILLGMQASESLVALARWIKLCGSQEAAMENLRGIVCQLLIRKLCETCREAYRPDPAVLAKANLSAGADEQFYRPPTGPTVDEKGRPIICEACQNSRYVGRTGVFEWMEINDEVRKLVVGRAPVQQIQSALRRNKMLYMTEQALEKVKQGLTSFQEVARVTQKEKK
ncbi:MAG: Type II secretion system protein E [Planctomycetes bacterium ADurb.Bin126]|nr:MAG: Type II secretion system protein E [Planctomycetes bacterium ADurb.Bin126]HOD80466.1 ATPase, T2SS/T4P/T4SS family [Phycisphaerae bacterium]HQL72078.1 ATPase, T2SS/T4P/T4SS family [Phycisphaerae bacterium]